MSLLRDYASKERKAFGGLWTLKDPSMVDARGALLARNVEFTADEVGTRHGFGAISTIAATTAPYEMYQWQLPLSSISSTYSDVSMCLADSLSANTFNLSAIDLKSGTLYASPGTGGLASTPKGASFVGVGMRLYFCAVDASQTGLASGGVLTVYNNSGSAGSYGGGLFNLFNPPSSYAPTTSEPAAGSVSAGVHRIGYLIEYVNGFTTRVSPDAAGSGVTPSITTFAPITFTAAGAKNARLSFALNWNSAHVANAEMIAVSVVMTNTSNLNQYYIVPGSRTLLASVGSTAAFTITFDISDADLASQGVDATRYLYWLTKPTTGAGATQPFALKHIALLGDRMGYLATATDANGNKIDALYISERNNYQAITADQHIVQLPGQRPITSMFRMNGVNYITGPHEIYAVSDNGDVPATWAAPALVDGRRGTLSVHGVQVSPGGSYAWLGDQSGLYLFTGAPLNGLPISYYQSAHWNAIDWSTPHVFHVKDDAGTKRVYVVSANSSIGLTTPTIIFKWDYTSGITPEAVRFSFDLLSGGYFGPIELFRNELSGAAAGNVKKIELWSAPAGQRPIRQMSDSDTSPWRDSIASGGVAIVTSYATAPFPGRDSNRGGAILHHHGFHARLKGTYTSMSPFISDIDATHTFQCRTAALSATPDKDELFLADLFNELAYVTFSGGIIDTYWRLSFIRWYYSPYLMQR